MRELTILDPSHLCHRKCLEVAKYACMEVLWKYYMVPNAKDVARVRRLGGGNCMMQQGPDDRHAVA